MEVTKNTTVFKRLGLKICSVRFLICFKADIDLRPLFASNHPEFLSGPELITHAAPFNRGSQSRYRQVVGSQRRGEWEQQNIAPPEVLNFIPMLGTNVLNGAGSIPAADRTKDEQEPGQKCVLPDASAPNGRSPRALLFR